MKGGASGFNLLESVFTVSVETVGCHGLAHHFNRSLKRTSMAGRKCVPPILLPQRPRLCLP